MAKKLDFKAMSARATQAAGMVAGVAASRFIGKTLSNTGKVSPKVSAGIRIAIGALLPVVIGDKKKAGIVTDVANGIMAEAATSLAGSFGVPGLSGLGGTDDYGAVSYAAQEDLLNGTLNYGAVSGSD